MQINIKQQLHLTSSHHQKHCFSQVPFPSTKGKESIHLDYNKRQTKLMTEEKTRRCYPEPLPSGSTEPHESWNRGGSVCLPAEARSAEFHNKASWNQLKQHSLCTCKWGGKSSRAKQGDIIRKGQLWVHICKKTVPKYQTPLQWSSKRPPGLFCKLQKLQARQVGISHPLLS